MRRRKSHLVPGYKVRGRSRPPHEEPSNLALQSPARGCDDTNDGALMPLRGPRISLALNPGYLPLCPRDLEYSVGRWRSIALTSGLIATAYGLGVWSQARHWPPATYLARAGDAVSRLVGGRYSPPATEDDAFGRSPVACPAAGERTMVALVFGQSQAANQVREHFVGGPQVFNYFRGRCYAAVDPLLGTGGDRGNVWTLIGTELVQQKRFDAVILVTIAIGGSSMAQWAPGGRLHEHLLRAITMVAPAFAFTHVFIAQGEADFLAQTPPEDYFRNFVEVIAALRNNGVGAPIFVAIESGYCDTKGTPPKLDNPIAAAQRRLIASQEGLYFGADMDAALNAAPDRYDGCHMSGTGARKLARLWTQAITAPVSGSAPRSERR
jgi:lysophospholipase L1-like esterase